MNHETAIDLVIDSLIDRGEAADTEELQSHLASCAECAAEAAGLREAWDALDLVGTADVGSQTAVRFGRALERRRSGSWRANGLRVAAAVVLLLGGAAIGRSTGRGATTVADTALAAASPEFLLLIRGDGPERRLPEAQLVREYRQWAIDQRGVGRLVSAEKLADDGGEWVSGASRSLEDERSAPVEGFFLVRAASYEEAVALARAHPHVGHGGTIEVRAIEATDGARTGADNR